MIIFRVGPYSEININYDVVYTNIHVGSYVGNGVKKKIISK